MAGENGSIINKCYDGKKRDAIRDVKMAAVILDILI